MWDFSWITELSAWAGLGTLVLLEVVLGVDNLVFISILVGRLPAEQKRHAFLTGLGLALLMRLVLLAAIAWIIGLTAPLFTLGGRAFSARDLILIGGGLFLLLKGTLELHERLEGHVSGPADAGRHAGFWRVIAQIIVLDAVFSLDSIITSVGMVDHVSVMMLAVVAAMLVMALAAAPLLRFVERHPSVIVLCLGFLLMIGLGLLTDGLPYSQGLSVRGHYFRRAGGSLQSVGAAQPAQAHQHARHARVHSPRSAGAAGRAVRPRRRPA